MRRFKTREELRQTGWSFQQDNNKEYFFQHPKVSPIISLEMLKNLHGLDEDTCFDEFAQYEYDDEMFTELQENTMIEKAPMLKNILGKEEYCKFLKAKALEQLLNEDYAEVKKIIDELLETTD
jgi:hypothetical protein